MIAFFFLVLSLLLLIEYSEVAQCSRWGIPLYGGKILGDTKRDSGGGKLSLRKLIRPFDNDAYQKKKKRPRVMTPEISDSMRDSDWPLLAQLESM